ncbi:MAG: beta strand repeat-containing protein, partial [Bacteroidota bacterium]
MYNLFFLLVKACAANKNFSSTSSQKFFSPKFNYAKVVIGLGLALGISQNGWGQVSVTATAGTLGPTNYATLNGASGAFAAINAGTHRGNITITITANYTEVAATGLNNSGSGASNYTSITIKPSGTRVITGPAATANGAVISLLGADNVTIDGDDPLTAGTRNLTIQSPTSNTSTVTQAVIRLASNATNGTNGANNNTVKNCIIIGSRATATSTVVNYGIVMTDASTNATGAYSSINTRIENNEIKRCWYGIHANGASATYPNTGTIILNNILGSATSADNIGFRGIYLDYTAITTGAALVRGNDIRVGDYGATGYATTIAGIEVNIGNFGIVIDKNNIHDINQPVTSGYGAHGIYVSSVTNNTSSTISNNFIRDVKMVVYQTSLTSTFVPSGLFFTAGATGVNFVGNTISLGTQLGSGANFSSYCVNASVSGVRFSKFQNNILVNNHSSVNAYCFSTSATLNISGGLVNNNCYYAPNGSAKVGYYNAAAITTLANWQTATSKDANSYNINPPFLSTTDLHINNTNSLMLSLFETGATGTGVTDDIDNDLRATNPCIGADEFVAPKITASITSLTAFSACVNTASSSQSFTVSGTNMQAAITVTAPTGFEVSTNNTTFSNSVNIGAAGTINSTTLYARMAALATSPTSGNITCTSANATTRNISVSGSVNSNTVGAASSTPTLCVSTLMTNITHATTGATGIGTTTGLPAGVTASFASNTITISGTPTASGTFNYTIPLTGGCGSFNATGTINVTAANTVGAASSTPTVCLNNAITAITHATTGGTGIGAATNLPPGVTASFASNTITISGTPSSSGVYNYSIPLTGGCGNLNATGTITVNLNTAGAASSSPTVCINSAITNITHATSGATGIGTPINLPSGVNASFASNTITISGTPSQSGTFNYTIPLTGGCGSINATGTIVVNPLNTIGAPSASPTVCVNTSITNITHATTGGTGIGSASGLPSGVTASFASNTITISGTPSATGVFNYTIPLTGGCGNFNATGSITVNASALSYYNLQFPASANICGGTTTVYGQVYEGGITDPAGANSTIEAQIGVSPIGS